MNKAWEKYILNIEDYPKPGVSFKDITPLIANGQAFRQVINIMAGFCQQDSINAEQLACPEARGFIFASALACQLEVGFLPIRKPGKLPRKTDKIKYELEYGVDELQIHSDDIVQGQKIVLVDDVLATGGTMAACVELLKKRGADVRACLFLMELEQLKGRERLQNVTVHSLIKY